MFREKIVGPFRGIEIPSLFFEVAERIEEFDPIFAADADEEPFAADFLFGREPGGKKGLEVIFADIGHFARGGHLDIGDRIGPFEPFVGKLGRFDADIVELERLIMLRGLYLFEEDLRCDLDEIVSGHFRDEGERAGCADVAFDHLDRIVFCDELDIERACDLKGFDNGAGDFFRSADRFEIEALRREDDRRIARMDAGIFHMFCKWPRRSFLRFSRPRRFPVLWHFR